MFTDLQATKPTVVEEVSEEGISAARDVTPICHGHPRHAYSIVGCRDFEILWLLTSSIHVELVTHTCPDVMTADIFIPYLLVLGAEEVDVAELAARRIQLLASVGIRGVANCQLDTD